MYVCACVRAYVRACVRVCVISTSLLENLLEHVHYDAASYHFSFRRRRQDAASNPVLDDHEDIIHGNMT